jgi:hypothetical protein
MKAIKPIDDTPFNMAMLYYLSLIKLLDKKDQAAINNDLIGWYRGLKAIYRRVSFKLKQDKRYGKKDTNFLNNKFNEVNNILFSDRSSNARIAAQVDEIVFSKSPEILDEIDIKLWEIMNRYKMIFPDFKTGGGLGALAESYGLT